MLPFALGWKACIAVELRGFPPCICVGFVKTDMANGFGKLHRLHAAKRPIPPSAVNMLPVKRRPPPLGLNLPPAIVQPEDWIRITTIIDKLQVLRVGDKPIGQS